MCVILVCPPKVRPSDEILRACDDANPHGAGVAWREGNRVHWRKNLKVGQVARLIREVKGEVVIHFRWASVGGVNPRLCHPFPVSRTAGLALHGKTKAVLFHNGTWGGWEEALDRLVSLGGHDDIDGPMSDTRSVAVLVDHLGEQVLERLPGRWVVMGSKATKLYGEWEEFKGMKVSNTNFVHRLPVQPPKKIWNHYPLSADKRAQARLDAYAARMGQLSLMFGSSQKPLTRKENRKMKLFKIVASKAGRIVFDDRVQADSPRTAREQMKSVLGLQSLTGVVYSITEIPVELLKELVNARVAEVVLNRNGRAPNVDLSGLIGAAVADAIGARLRPIEQRLDALEAPGQSNTTRRRFDAFQRESTQPNAAETPAPETPAAPAARPAPRRQSRARQITGRTVADVNWAMIRRFYSRCKSPKQTAAHFDISLNTVKARIRREDWK